MFRNRCNNTNNTAVTGFAPIKVNSVIIRDFNDDEIIKFAELSAKYNIL